VLLLSATPALAADTGATVRGRIVSERGALPIAGAAVIVSRAGKPVASGTTGSDGIFRIGGIPAGISNQLVLVSDLHTA
jgi:hypothetical protein